MATDRPTGSPRRHTAVRDEPRRSRLLLAGVVCVAAVALFAFNVHASYFVSDDSYISFRYARHLAQGEGLVWNPGERVEGYTNFLWVLLMSAAIRLGLAPELVANVVGILSGAILLVLLPLFSARWSEPFAPTIWIAPLALAGNRSFTAWCTGGLETMLFTALVFGAFAAWLGERARAATLPLVSPALFAVATLTRPEGALFAFLAALCWLAEILARRRPLRPSLIWAAVYLAPVGAHLLWRHAYYGFWVPNSFRAKVAGAWWEQGSRYLSLFADDYHLAWVLPLAVLGLLLRRRLEGWLFAAALAVYLLYVAYIGGDRFEFRFLVVVFPYLYWLAGDAVYQLAARGRGRSKRHAAVRWGAVACAVVALASSLAGSRGAGVEGMRHHVESLNTVRTYGARRAEEGRFLRSLVDRGLLPENLVLCVGGAGAVPYITRWPTLDRRGLNDARIAGMPLKQRGVVAHERDVPYDYLVERRVVIFDIFNRLVHRRDILRGRPAWIPHDGRPLRLRGIRVDGRYLLFATTLSDRDFRTMFARLEIVH
jgi:hypothetical protein